MKNGKDLKILLCLPFHGGRNDDILRSVLNTILDQDYPKKALYLFLLDNMSDDTVKKAATDFVNAQGSKFWGGEVVRTEGTVPYLRNLGIDKALSLHCDYILHLDSDVLLKPDTLSKLVKIAKEDDKIFSVGRLYLVPLDDEGFIYGTKRRYARFSKLDIKEVVDVENVGLGATIMRLSLIDKVGKFDPRIPYIEDLDIHRRAINLGYRIIFDKREPLVHLRKFTTWEVMRVAYISGRAELVSMRKAGTWKTELRSSIYWLSLILSIPLTMVTAIPFIILTLIGFLRYFVIAKGKGRILLFPAMFLSKVPKTLGLIRALLG